jgi:altered-inheritance-of-mitochondria protein 5
MLQSELPANDARNMLNRHSVMSESSLLCSLTSPVKSIKMAGFILGTGTGVLAAAATYYTLSTHLHKDTDVLREE